MLVLGMHRAGTSAVARVVNLLGVPTAASEHLKDSSPVNPEGFWEIEPLTAVNDAILEALGGDWSCPPAPPAGWERAPELAALRERARAEAGRILPAPLWLWKDPRNCVTLPLWLEALDVSPAAVIVHRDPLEVCGSLEERNGFSRTHSLALWERHARGALAAAQGGPAFVLSYDALVTRPSPTVAALAEFLAPLGVRRDTAEAAGSVRADLRRARTGGEALESAAGVTEPQRALAARLRELEGAHQSLPAATLPPESPVTELVLSERARGRAEMRATVAKVQARDAELRELLDDTRAKLDEAKLTKARLRREVAQIRGWRRFVPHAGRRPGPPDDG